MQTTHNLQLARSENIGKSTFFRLLEIFGSAQNALQQLPAFAESGGLKRKIKICSLGFEVQWNENVR
jgi:hypothetical protein